MTIKRPIYSLYYLLLFFICTVDLHGQVKDFQSWWELELNKKITGSLDLNGEIEQRFKNNSLQYGRTLLTLGANYDLFDFLSLGGGARTIFVLDGEHQMHLRYRLHLDVLGSYRLSGFNLSLRTRLQYGFEEYLEFRYFGVNALVNRNRLKVIHHIYGTRIDWFATLESYHGSNNESQWMTYSMRYSAGIRFSPDFSSRFSLRYILEDEFNVPAPMQLHILVLGYSYDF
jgi:hypothetical protein